MNDEEKELVLLLNDVYDKYMSLPEQHYQDRNEFVNALHVLQHLIMIRSVRRMNPDMFPLNLKVDAKLESLDDMSPIEKAIQETLDNALGAKVKEK